MAKKDMPAAEAPVQEAAPAAAVISNAPKTKPEVNASGLYCYIGPSIKGLIRHGDIYRGTREDARRAARDAIKANKLVKSLIVPGDELPEARIKVKTPGNALYKNYRKIAEAGKEQEVKANG